MPAGPGDWPSQQSTGHARPDRDGPTRWQIARAIQAGTRRTRNQQTWIGDVLADEEFTGFRPVRRRHWEAMARVLAGHMGWETRCTMPGWETLAGRAGRPGHPLHKSTVARFLVWLRERGYLGVVLHGWTPALRAASLTDPDDENQRAVYVLTSPGRHSQKRAIRPAGGHGTVTNATLTRKALLSYSPSHTRAREADGQVKNQVKNDEERAPRAQPSVLPRGGVPAATRGRKSQDRGEGLEWARSVRELAPVLAGLSDAHVRHLGRRQRLAGWSPRDFVHALLRSRQGRPYGFSADVRHPAAWASARLSAWLAPDGSLWPSASQVRAADRAAVRAEQEARRAAQEAIEARAVDAVTSGHGERARRALAAASSRAAAVIVQGAADVRRGVRAAAAAPSPPAEARSTPRSARRAAAPPPVAQPAPVPPPRAPDLPSWWTDAVAAAARVVAEEEAAERVAHAGPPGTP